LHLSATALCDGGSRQTITRPELAPFPVGGAGYSGEPHVLVSADTRIPECLSLPLQVSGRGQGAILNRQKASFGKKGKLLNLGHLDFDIVSTTRCPVECFVFRIFRIEIRFTRYEQRTLFCAIRHTHHAIRFNQN
jgi:hypothetical protein